MSPSPGPFSPTHFSPAGSSRPSIPPLTARVNLSFTGCLSPRSLPLAAPAPDKCSSPADHMLIADLTSPPPFDPNPFSPGGNSSSLPPTPFTPSCSSSTRSNPPKPAVPFLSRDYSCPPSLPLSAAAHFFCTCYSNPPFSPTSFSKPAVHMLTSQPLHPAIHPIPPCLLGNSNSCRSSTPSPVQPAVCSNSRSYPLDSAAPLLHRRPLQSPFSSTGCSIPRSPLPAAPTPVSFSSPPVPLLTDMSPSPGPFSPTHFSPAGS
ncbi:uncharacterized protein [Narcine bancroftii]|uniref:uncharacterized protein n=1 Tax=Narcine bancroftii TaxID=1343680 RepID=UPI0038316788